MSANVSLPGTPASRGSGEILWPTAPAVGCVGAMRESHGSGDRGLPRWRWVASSHGLRRGWRPLPPPPPPPGGEGEQKGVGAIFPRAFALGHNISPLPGLRKALRHEEDFVNELLTQDTRMSLTAKKSGVKTQESE